MSTWLEQQQIAFPYPGMQCDALFDYFADEFLKAVSPQVREFLLAARSCPA